MKKIIIILLSVFWSQSLLAQITLKDCIEKGLANKSDIKIAKTDQLLESLKSIETKAKYLPQINLAYDYRYNPIIASQVVPVGQFNPIPTDETRALQFGTNWQQNATLTVYQPIIDAALNRRMKESKIKESISSVDLEKAENNLQFDIVKTYLRALTLTHQVEEAIADTVRSHTSYAIVKAKFSEGKVLKIELNTSLINHNNNLISFKKSVALLFNEKIYLHYLTNIELEQLLDAKFSNVPVTLFDAPNEDANAAIESTPEFKRLLLRQQLLTQQIKTEKAKYIPTIGFQGLLGANQFSNDFVPFQGSSWFGTNYVGIFVKLPIFAPEKSVNGVKQLQTQYSSINFEKEELRADSDKKLRQILIEIEKLKDELKIKKENLTLLAENIILYQQRIKNGQVATSELNLQEAEIQKLKAQINQLDEDLKKAKAERLFISGELSSRLKTL